MSSNIVLHYNTGSAYAMRARLQLDYAGVTWQGCKTSKGLPRPTLEQLVGSYCRRVPVLQLGSDLYCDAASIAKAVSDIADKPELAPWPLPKDRAALLSHIEEVGNPAILGSFSLGHFLYGYFANLPWSEALAFFIDRKNMVNAAPQLKALRDPKTSIRLTHEYLALLNQRLSQATYLAGEQPSVLDFAAFTMIWYQDMLTRSKLIKPYPYVVTWLKQMQSHFVANRNDVSQQQALELARTTAPKAIPARMLSSNRLDQRIDFVPNDKIGSALNLAVSGKLVGEDEHSLILARNTPQVGTVHLHFPKHCFGACG